ncbi:MAG: MEDS domain-containing protein [Candidatus Bathyarchaeia archaeon]
MEELLQHVKKMKPGDHVMLIYSDLKEKHEILFTYLEAGLEKGEAAAYVASEEAPEQIKRAMRKFGVDVTRCERNRALKVIDYKDWYVIDGKFDPRKTIRLWGKLLEELNVRGFKGLRATGEMACFFEHEMVKELVEYERAQGRTWFPMTALCAYNLKHLVDRKGGVELLLQLINAHAATINRGGVNMTV